MHVDAPTQAPADSPWRRYPEAAAHLRISQRLLAQLAADGEIATYHVGRAVRFHVADLDAYLLAQRVSA